MPGGAVPFALPDTPEAGTFEALAREAMAHARLTNDGPLVARLEEELAARWNCSPVQAVCNGTVALEVALKSVGVDGGEVITTPFTFQATVNAVRWIGAVPRLVDVDPKTWNLDPDEVARAVTPKTQAILGVHVFGVPCDAQALAEVADEHNLPLIYDAAHCGARGPTADIHLRDGDVSTVSLHATKPVHAVEGGAIVCKDPTRMAWIRRAVRHGLGDTPAVGGTNGRMSELHAAFGLALLPTLQARLAARHAVAQAYRHALADAPIRFQAGAEPGTSGTFFPLLLPDETTRDNVAARLAAEGIEARSYFSPLAADPQQHDQPPPMANDVSRRVLCLPLHGHVGRDRAAAIGALVTDTVT